MEIYSARAPFDARQRENHKNIRRLFGLTGRIVPADRWPVQRQVNSEHSMSPIQMPIGLNV